MSFSTRLKEARERKGYSRAQVAKMLEVSLSAISNYENAISHPKEEIMYKFFNILDVDANFLFQDEMKQFTSSDKNDENAQTSSLISSELCDIAKDLSEEEQLYMIDIIKSYKKLKNTILESEGLK